jgi:hypothetical protein
MQGLYKSGHHIKFPDDHSVGPNFWGLLNYFLAFAPRLSTARLPKDSRREGIDRP